MAKARAMAMANHQRVQTSVAVDVVVGRAEHTDLVELCFAVGGHGAGQ